MITAIETLQSVAHHAVANPPAPKSTPEDAGGRPDRPPASLAGLLPRAARMMVRLLLARTPGGGTHQVLAHALSTFLPLLGLDWLPADPSAIRKPTIPVKSRLDLLRQERAARARLRCAVARHRPARRARPDRPPENRAAASGLEWAGEPEEVVTTALYLASDASSFTTGAVVRVDGGAA